MGVWGACVCTSGYVGGLFDPPTKTSTGNNQGGGVEVLLLLLRNKKVQNPAHSGAVTDSPQHSKNDRGTPTKVRGRNENEIVGEASKQNGGWEYWRCVA